MKTIQPFGKKKKQKKMNIRHHHCDPGSQARFLFHIEEQMTVKLREQGW